MAQRERVYERPLKQPLDEQKKLRVSEVVQRHLGSVMTGQQWDAKDPVLTITSSLATLIISFTETNLVVEAEYGWAARLFLTDDNRRKARGMAIAIAEEADL